MSNRVETRNCGTHGDYQSRNYLGTVWTQCPACSEEHDREREAIEAERQRAKSVQNWTSKLGCAQIPHRFQDKTLESFEVNTPPQMIAKGFAMAYVNDFNHILRTGRSALFLGKPGTGKTHLAAAIALRIMQEQKRTALFTTILRAVRRVKETWRRDSSMSESEAIGSLVFPDLLVLDEVGVQFGTEAEKTILFDVLNERYERCKPCLLLSNLTAEEVRAYLGERIYDRLRENGGSLVVFDWESHRA